MRIIYYLVMLLLILIMSSFALSNVEPVKMGLWPLDLRVALPAFSWVLLSVLAGFILGLFTSFFIGRKKRSKILKLKKKAEQTEKDTNIMRSEVEALAAQRDILPQENMADNRADKPENRLLENK